MVRKGEFYTGSLILTPISDVIGLPIDQVNFLGCQLLSFCLAYPFRTVLCPTKTSPVVRHVVELSLGIALSAFCFGYQVLHLLAQSVICYLLMRLCSPTQVHKAVMVVAMVYLSVAHIYRQYYDYGGYTMDITGPLMIFTQKVTSLAFNLHDGYRIEHKLTEPEKRPLHVTKVPNPLSYFSYLFYFHGIMVGPFTFYTDYKHFIEGTGYEREKMAEQNGNFKYANSAIPSPSNAATKKFVLALVCGTLMKVLPPFFPSEFMTQEEFYEYSILGKMLFAIFSLMFLRSRYYFAWALSEALNNAAGLGFSGYDSHGTAQWNRLDNVDILAVECGTSLKSTIDNWNMTTLVWLRKVVYDRAPPKYRTIAVFACSAIWHGFYPGYYITFASAALCTVTARLVRRNIRPFFQTSANLAFIYDCITFVVARFVVAYCLVPFIILELIPSIKFYLYMYGWLHALCLVMIVYFTYLAPRSTNTKSEKKPS